MLVELSAADVRYAKSMAYVRNAHAMIDKKRERQGATPMQALGIHEVGCLGERAVMMALGIPPKLSIDSYRNDPDIPPCQQFPNGAEVRTRTEHWHDLPIREDDDPTKPYILAILSGDRSVVRLVGWIYGHEAMDRAEWYKDPNGRGAAWFVPQTTELMRPFLEVAA